MSQRSITRLVGMKPHEVLNKKYLKKKYNIIKMPKTAFQRLDQFLDTKITTLGNFRVKYDEIKKLKKKARRLDK